MLIRKHFRNVTCKEYCEKNNLHYSIILNGQHEKVFLPNYLEENDYASHYIDVYHPEIIVAEIPNVNLIGCTNIIFNNRNICIYDLPSFDTENKYELHCGSTYYVDKNTTSVRCIKSPIIIEEGLMLVSTTSYNFTHFNLELLTKLLLLNNIETYNNVPLIVDERISHLPGFMEELSLLNKLNRKIIYVKEQYSYKVNKLIYISDITIIPTNLKLGYHYRYEDFLINSHSIKLLHNNLSTPNTPFRKIFISRQYSSNSRLINQTIVEDIFKQFEYEIINSELLSLKDKTKLFSEAEFIAGAYGAGFTNTLFANSSATIICIQPKAIEVSLLSTLFGTLNQKFYFIDGELSSNTPFRYYQNQFTADVDSLKKLLNSLHKI